MEKYREFINGRFHYWGFVEEGIFKGPVTPSFTRGKHQIFTGLKDKNGVDIYAGDILLYREGDFASDDDSHHRIFWDDKRAMFWDERLEDGDSLAGYLDGDISWVIETKVIGNIFQNPELLK